MPTAGSSFTRVKTTQTCRSEVGCTAVWCPLTFVHVVMRPHARSLHWSVSGFKNILFCDDASCFCNSAVWHCILRETASWWNSSRFVWNGLWGNAVNNLFAFPSLEVTPHTHYQGDHTHSKTLGENVTWCQWTSTAAVISWLHERYRATTLCLFLFLMYWSKHITKHVWRLPRVIYCGEKCDTSEQHVPGSRRNNHLISGVEKNFWSPKTHTSPHFNFLKKTTGFTLLVKFALSQSPLLFGSNTMQAS